MRFGLVEALREVVEIGIEQVAVDAEREAGVGVAEHGLDGLRVAPAIRCSGRMGGSPVSSGVRRSALREGGSTAGNSGVCGSRRRCRKGSQFEHREELRFAWGHAS